MGLLETLSLYMTAVLAIPIALLGVEFLLGGRFITGGGFLAVAAAVVVARQYVPSVLSPVISPVEQAVMKDRSGSETRRQNRGDESDDE